MPKLLVVDDEPNILTILARQLRGKYAVHTAGTGALGLAVLAREPDMALILSDMRMPQMNGTAFLAHAKAAAPDAVRLLLTGQCDMQDAIGAINQGCIFRFLEKPCELAVMFATLADALAQHRLILAERELLELTLRGSIKALCDTFALVNPGVFGIAQRAKRLATDIAARIGGVELWQVEVAAMLCQLGAMTLPAGLYDRRAQRDRLTPAEREMLARVPATTDHLLAPIPRLDAIREIVRHCRADRRMVSPIPRAADILRGALDFDELETAGLTPREAIARMRSMTDLYEPDVLEALDAFYLSGDTHVVEMPVGRLLEGMILAADLIATGGRLLVSRGQEVTPGMLRRLENFDESVRQQLIGVVADQDFTPVRARS